MLCTLHLIVTRGVFASEIGSPSFWNATYNCVALPPSPLIYSYLWRTFFFYTFLSGNALAAVESWTCASLHYTGHRLFVSSEWLDTQPIALRLKRSREQITVRLGFEPETSPLPSLAFQPLGQRHPDACHARGVCQWSCRDPQALANTIHRALVSSHWLQDNPVNGGKTRS